MSTNINNNNNQEEFDMIPGLQIMCLTSEEDDYHYYTEEEECNWIDDCECQENLATILPLNPEECIVDKDNHIQNMDGIQLFFEEIGIIYDEPEPIDPTRDYEAEAQILIEERNKTRKQHVDLESPIPSLDDTLTNSGISSTSSSFHHDEAHTPLMDIRSPLYMGWGGGNQKMTAYAYAPHVFSPIRTPI
jgi:hypothetical protein